MYIFESKLVIDKPIYEVFEFFCKAENLQKLTPPTLNFKILSELPIEMKKGSRINYRIKLYGVPVIWKTEITKWDPPFEFEDTQLKGPYKLWKHRHIFKDLGDKTEMTDIVEYNPKGFPFNTILDKLIVKKEIEKIFNYRTEKINQYFK